MTTEKQDMLWRGLMGLCFLVALWSLGQSTDLLSLLREFVSRDPPWGGIRLFCSLLPIVLVPVAFILGPKTRQRLFWPLALVSVLVLFDVTLGGRDPDEPVHLRMIWMMGEGLVPYQDFFTVRHLLWHAMCIPMVKLMGGSLYVVHAARVLMFLISVGCLALLVPLARRCHGHYVAPLLAVAVPFYAWGAVEFRADPPMTFLLLAALVALGRKAPVWAGVLSGVAFLMLQKAAFHGIAMGAGILLSGMGWQCFFRYSAGAVSVSLLHALWAVLWGVWNDYYLCTIKSSGVFASFHQQTPIVESLPVLVFGQELAFYPLLFILALIGTVLWWRSGEQFSRLMAVCLVVDLALVFVGKIGFKNYLLFPVALLALAASRAYAEAESRQPASRLEAALPTAALLLALAVGAIRHSAMPPTSIDISEASLVASRLPADELYFTDSHRGNLVSPIYRMNPTYYAHSASRFRYWFLDGQAEAPKYMPGDPERLLENPPGCFVMPPKGAAEFLALARERKQIEYVEILKGVYLRKDLAEAPSVSGKDQPTLPGK
jgi:hypothetical protein